MSKNSFGARTSLEVAGKTYEIFDITKLPAAADLPYSLKILLENLLRTEDGANITASQIDALASWNPNSQPDTEIQFTPARVIMQDFTGVPCVVDLATMREAIAELGGNPSRVNPLAPAELVIDHSVIADTYGTPDAFKQNVDIEYERNQERYRFLRWGQSAFDEFKVVPPGTGIVHQVNIEYLARVVMVRDVNGVERAYPDTVVGTDSHTTMVNGLGVLGWGVGGIEAEAALLGQPVSMLIPRVVGFKLSGSLPTGTTATDLVLMITEMLRKHGVVGKFVEFYGPGVSALPMANRATIGNMSPEYGSTIAIFPIDEETLKYLELTGRSQEQRALVESYAKRQGIWHDPSATPRYSEHLELDLASVVPSIAGPKRPQDRVSLSDAKSASAKSVPTYLSEKSAQSPVPVTINARPGAVTNGSVVIASITSCTNTPNPSVMIGAGLLAKKAVDKGAADQAQPANFFACLQKADKPFGVGGGTIGGIKEKVALDHRGPKKGGRRQCREVAGPSVPPRGWEHLPLAESLPGGVHHNHISNPKIRARISGNLILHPSQSPGQILLVTIQIGTDPTASPLQSLVDRIIHSVVRLGNHHPAISLPIRPPLPHLLRKLRKPLRLCILHNMLHRHALLIGHRGNAASQPVQLPIARRHDREIHVFSLLSHLPTFKPSPSVPLGLVSSRKKSGFCSMGLGGPLYFLARPHEARILAPCTGVGRDQTGWSNRGFPSCSSSRSMGLPGRFANFSRN